MRQIPAVRINRMGCRISGTVRGSIADELGVIAGEELISINGQPIRDIIDYEYQMAEEKLLLLVKGSQGGYEAEIEKEEYEDIGLVFDSGGLGRKKLCRNKCVFCFVDQMPGGLRETLYVKDDDWRLSFLMGNYITLTNLSESDIERIIGQGISPLYVSVHSADPALSTHLFRNKHAAGSFDIIRRLAGAGVKLHTQIVVCEGLNDREELTKTLEELYALRPGVKSVCVVPVGLTAHREGLPEVAAVSKEGAADAIRRVETVNARSLGEHGERFAYAADEMYVKAGIDIPPYEYYGAFENIENGVGMVAKFESEASEAIERYAGERGVAKRFAIATGADFYPFMADIARRISDALGVEINVYTVYNDFFGRCVTVTGLLTGADITAQLAGRLTEDVLLISKGSFKENDELTLDGMTLSGISDALGMETRAVAVDGYCFVREFIDSEELND